MTNMMNSNWSFEDPPEQSSSALGLVQQIGCAHLSLLTVTRFAAVVTVLLRLRSRLPRQSRSWRVDHSRFRRQPRFAFQRSLPLLFWCLPADPPWCLRNFMYFRNDVQCSLLQKAHERDAHGSGGMSQEVCLFGLLSCCRPSCVWAAITCCEAGLTALPPNPWKSSAARADRRSSRRVAWSPCW